MFPNNSSVTRPLPSLLPGSGGTPSPAFTRYYEAATTAVVSRLPLRLSSVGPDGLVIDFADFAHAEREVPRSTRRVFFFPVSPISGLWSQGPCGAHKFPENPIVPLPCSWTPVEPRCLAFAALRYCPPTTERGGPRQPWSFRSSITRPQHSLFTLRAVITDDDAKLASGGGCPLPGGIPVYPLSSVGKFLPCGFPFPWASLVAIRSTLYAASSI